MRYFDVNGARKRIDSAKPVYADFFSKATGKQTRIRVVKIIRAPFGIALKGINNEMTEDLTPDRVVFTDG